MRSGNLPQRFFRDLRIPGNLDMLNLEKRREENSVHHSAHEQKTQETKPKKSIFQNLFDPRSLWSKPLMQLVSLGSHVAEEGSRESDVIL